MRVPVRTITLAAILWLTGCVAAAPSDTRYVLPGDDGSGPSLGTEREHLLRMHPPRLALHLDVDGIVMQLDDITLVAANHHRWAEPLDRQLERGLRARLTSRLADTRVVYDDGGLQAPQARVLHLEVERFQGHHDGRAVIAGHWQLRDPDGSLVAMAPFAAERDLAADGYPALVRALGRGWDDVADEIAAAIERLR